MPTSLVIFSASEGIAVVSEGIVVAGEGIVVVSEGIVKCFQIKEREESGIPFPF